MRGRRWQTTLIFYCHFKLRRKKFKLQIHSIQPKTILKFINKFVVFNMREYFNGRFSLTCLLSGVFHSLLHAQCSNSCRKTINWHFRQNCSFILPSFACGMWITGLSSAKNLNAHETWKMQCSVFWYFSSWCSLSFLANEGRISFFKVILNWKWYTTVVSTYLFRPISIAQLDGWSKGKREKLKSQSKKKFIFFETTGREWERPSNMKTKQWSKNQKYEITTHENIKNMKKSTQHQNGLK